MELVTLRHPLPSFANAFKRFEGDPIVYDPRLYVMAPALVRFRKSSVNELLAYRFADLLGLRHLPYVGFWCPDRVMLKHGYSRAGRIGLALEWRGTPVVSFGWCNRARAHPNTVAQLLALSVLRYSGDIQIALTRDLKVVPFAMGGLLPEFGDVIDARGPAQGVDEFDPQDLEILLAPYDPSYHIQRSIDAVLSDADRYGVLNRVAAIIERVVQMPDETLISGFDLSPHPRAADIRLAAAYFVREQFDSALAMV